MTPHKYHFANELFIRVSRLNLIGKNPLRHFISCLHFGPAEKPDRTESHYLHTPRKNRVSSLLLQDIPAYFTPCDSSISWLRLARKLPHDSYIIRLRFRYYYTNVTH